MSQPRESVKLQAKVVDMDSVLPLPSYSGSSDRGSQWESDSEDSVTVRQVYCLPLREQSLSVTPCDPSDVYPGSGSEENSARIDHNLFYSSSRGHKSSKRIGISLLPDLNYSNHGSVYSYMTEEMKNTQDEVRELVRENRELIEKIEQQERHIEQLKVMYRDQTVLLHKELKALKEVCVSREKLLTSDTKPTLETEETVSPTHPCCGLF